MQGQGYATEQRRIRVVGYAQSCSECRSAWGQKQNGSVTRGGGHARDHADILRGSTNLGARLARSCSGFVSFAFRARQSYRCWRLSSSACSPPSFGRPESGWRRRTLCWCERVKLPA
ncbi:hypothetical protein PAHAL_4G051000 [Panicum hallii]|uniref:Uncharacterized protein n=1 Tax=Panicum hallii TaxID=206008 RepID=A0A2T8JBW0_9POAL|nr:hypothetical protein PAHAL_4G051000 [Panicum hallii]